MAESPASASAPGASIADIVAALNNANTNMSLLIRTLQGLQVASTTATLSFVPSAYLPITLGGVQYKIYLYT